MPEISNIPEGYEAEDINDDFRRMGMSEAAIAELSADIDRQVEILNNEAANDTITPDVQNLLDIIDSPDTTWEEKEEARRKLDPDMYDENGNLVLDDSEFYDRIEADMKRLYEEMKARGEAI